MAQLSCTQRARAGARSRAHAPHPPRRACSTSQAASARTAGVLQAMTSVDYTSHVALVAEAHCDDGATRLVAEARYVVPADAAGEAKFALAVADDWQGRGLGRALLSRLARHARRRDLQRLQGTVLADNLPMIALLRRLGATIHDDPVDAAVVHALVETRVPDWPPA
jgi:acetyltransferase